MVDEKRSSQLQRWSGGSRTFLVVVALFMFTYIQHTSLSGKHGVGRALKYLYHKKVKFGTRCSPSVDMHVIREHHICSNSQFTQDSSV